MNYQEKVTGLFREYYMVLCGFAEKALPSREEAQDIVSGVFEKLLVTERKFTNDNTIKAYLYHAVKNDIVTYYRKKKLHLAAEAELSHRLQNNDYHLRQVLKYEVMREFNMEVNAFPPQRKKIFIRSFINDLPTAQVAEELALSPSTVSNEKSKAAIALGKKLFNNDFLSAAIIAGTAAAIITLGVLLLFSLLS